MAAFQRSVGEKEEERFFAALSLPEDGCFYLSCLPMRPFESEFNGE